MLTLVVCNDTSCGNDTYLDTTGERYQATSTLDAIQSTLAAIENVDKYFLGALLPDDDEASVIGGSGLGSSSNPIFASSEDQAIISQFNLENGSVASFLWAALLSAVSPFVVAFIFLGLHQAWLRHRIPRKAEPAPSTVTGEDTAEEGAHAKSISSRSNYTKKRAGLALLAGLAVTAFAVMLPVVVLLDGDEPERLVVFEQGVTVACPECVNGVPTADYLEATPITILSRAVRLMVMSPAVTVSGVQRREDDWL